MIRTSQALLILLSLSSFAWAQSTPASAPVTNGTSAGSVSMAPILADLDRLQTAASRINSELAYMRIDKWKADSGSKQQAQSNADSIQRNVAEALPALISSVRNAPQDVNAEFKLYRNLNALYDVFASLTESAGAFGPRGDYDALAQQLGMIDSVRRSLGDHLEQLTSSTQSELNQLRTEVHTLQERAAAPPAPPKKVIVDDTEPAKKTTTAHKKKPAPKTTPDAGSSGSTSSQGASGSAAPVAKAQ